MTKHLSVEVLNDQTKIVRFLTWGKKLDMGSRNAYENKFNTHTKPPRLLTTYDIYYNDYVERFKDLLYFLY